MGWARGASASTVVANYPTTTALMLSPGERVDTLNRGGQNNKRLALVMVFAYRNPLKAPHKRCWFNITLPEDLKQMWKMRPGPRTRSPVSLPPGHNIVDHPLKCHLSCWPFHLVSYSFPAATQPSSQAGPFCSQCPNFCISPNGMGSRSGWLSRLSGWLQLRSWSHGPWVQALRRALCWQLRAWSLFQILCLPLSLTLPRSCSVSLCLKNK